MSATILGNPYGTLSTIDRLNASWLNRLGSRTLIRDIVGLRGRVTFESDAWDRDDLRRSSPDFLRVLKSDSNEAWGRFHTASREFFRLRPPPVFRNLSRDVQEELADEIISDCRRHDFRSLRSYENRGLPFAAWISRIAIRRAIDHIAWEKRTRRLPPLTPAPIAPPADEQVYENELSQVVDQCIEELSEKCQVLINGKARGWTLEDLSKILNPNQPNAKKAGDDLCYCRKKLKKRLIARGFGFLFQSRVGEKQ